MTLKVDNVTISSIGEMETVGDARLAWAEVCLKFTDTDINTHPSVKLLVNVRYDPDSTMGKVREEALDQARQILFTASDHLA